MKVVTEKVMYCVCCGSPHIKKTKDCKWFEKKYHCKKCDVEFLVDYIDTTGGLNVKR